MGCKPSWVRIPPRPSAAQYRSGFGRGSIRGVAQPGRALRSGRRGRRFKSCLPDSREGLPFSAATKTPGRGNPVGRFCTVVIQRARLQRARHARCAGSVARCRSISLQRDKDPRRSHPRRVVVTGPPNAPDVIPGIPCVAARGDDDCSAHSCQSIDVADQQAERTAEMLVREVEGRSSLAYIFLLYWRRYVTLRRRSLTGKAADSKSAGFTPLGVRVPPPPLFS